MRNCNPETDDTSVVDEAYMVFQNLRTLDPEQLAILLIKLDPSGGLSVLTILNQLANEIKYRTDPKLPEDQFRSSSLNR